MAISTKDKKKQYKITIKDNNQNKNNNNNKDNNKLIMNKDY